MALPTTNISVAMVKAELGAATNDVGRLCIHPNINKWSKHKPVRHPKVGELTEGDLQSVNCGLLVYPATADYTLLTPSPLMWFYLKPRGDTVSPIEPYRLHDFRNYNHEGQPVVSIPNNSIIVNKIVDPILNMQINLVTYATMPMDDPSIMRIEDLDISIGDLYYAIAFEWLGQRYVKTATGTIGDLIRTVSFNFSTEYPLNIMSPQTLVFHNVLSNIPVTDLTLIDELEDPILFSPLPLSDSSDNKVSVQLRNESGLIITPLKVAPSNMFGVGEFIDIPYYPPVTPLIAPQGITLRIRVQNYTQSTITFPISGWQIQANPTYWGANTNYFNASIANEAGTTYLFTPPEIPPGGEITVCITVNNLLNMNGTSPQAVTTKETITSSIRFRNGIYEGNTSLHATSME
jgi:hypothetical protein